MCGSLNFIKLFTYNIILSFRCIPLVIQHLYTLRCDHHGKSSNQRSPYKVIRILTLFPVLCLTSHDLFYN